MHSNTAREGCDPGGAFSPANENRRAFPFAVLGVALALVGLIVGLSLADFPWGDR